MKKTLLFFTLTLIFNISISGHRNYTQELIDLLTQGRCFEAMDFKKQHKDSISNDRFFSLFYQYHMASFFYKPDSAAIYLEEILQQKYESLWGPNIAGMRGTLLKLYDTSQQYNKAIALCDTMIGYYKRNPFDMPEDYLENEIDFAHNIQSAIRKKSAITSRISIVEDQISKELKLSTDTNFICFDADYNNTPVKTLFDTGVSSYFFMRKSIADSIGVKTLNYQQDTIEVINGIRMKATHGIVDSVKIGSLHLYNIPTVIFHDKFTANIPDSLLNKLDIIEKIKAIDSIQIIMGLPAMKLIGRFEFNWSKNTIHITSFTHNEESVPPNIYTINNNLYTLINVNGLNLNSLIDTGDTKSFIDIAVPFYEKNKSVFNLDSEQGNADLRHMYLGHTYSDIKYSVVLHPNIQFEGKVIKQGVHNILIYDFPQDFINVFDGIVGYRFFRKLGCKTILDLNNMRLESK